MGIIPGKKLCPLFWTFQEIAAFTEVCRSLEHAACFKLIFHSDEFRVQFEKLSLSPFKFYEIGNYHKFKDYQRSLLSQQCEYHSKYRWTDGRQFPEKFICPRCQSFTFSI